MTQYTWDDSRIFWDHPFVTWDGLLIDHAPPMSIEDVFRQPRRFLSDRHPGDPETFLSSKTIAF